MVNAILSTKYETKACCCGHGKYPRTLIVGLKKGGDKCFEFFTGKLINRKRNFYKKDGDGYYYIQEVSKPRRLPTTSRRIHR